MFLFVVWYSSVYLIAVLFIGFDGLFLCFGGRRYSALSKQTLHRLSQWCWVHEWSILFIYLYLFTNITIWQNNNYPPHRKNPYRHQIDFILAHTSWKRNNTYAKSLNTFNTHSDHKIVLSKFKINWQIVYKRQNTYRSTSVDHLRNPALQKKYHQSVKE